MKNMLLAFVSTLIAITAFALAKQEIHDTTLLYFCFLILYEMHDIKKSIKDIQGNV
jgi:4-hydroxybenzoate polyprenyltransferase